MRATSVFRFPFQAEASAAGSTPGSGMERSSFKIGAASFFSSDAAEVEALRRRFGFIASALISAAVFAVAHGYGVLGFASVLWSGVLWAWVYERSGSVLPGMLAHMLNNAVVCLAVILFLR